MSGGVDSSVAAAMLHRDGHEVVGAYMKNWINEENIVGNCPWQEDIDDARATAEAIGIDFHVVNLMKDYRERVVKYLLDGYREGVTPNPDVMCNREMKFGVFLDWALEHGFEGVATGHYARRVENPDGSCDILRGADPNKDQSYFLTLMRQEQIRRALFPIGEMEKPRVRELADAFGLPNAGKKDSQGICFIGEVKMSDFLTTFVPDSPGNIVDLEGNILGEHRGLHLYTLGQRKGIGVPSNRFKEAYVVVEKRGATRELVVAFDREDTPRLYARRCRLGEMSYTNIEITGSRDLLAQPRYRTPAERARFSPGDGELVYEEPQRALTPGQICALYDGDRLLGGGVFQEIHHDDPLPVS